MFMHRCLPMLGPLGEDFAKVKASITTALDKITQVLKIAIKMAMVGLVKSITTKMGYSVAKQV